MTLLMACMFTAGWVRSFYLTDMILFPTANAMNQWISDSHGLSWLVAAQTDEEHEEQMQDIDVPFVISFAFPQSLNLRGWKQKWSFWGFSSFHRHELTDTAHIIPYWSIVIPLTTFSAWLLLSRPKQACIPPVPPNAGKDVACVAS